jgi:3-oxoadipate enol-lactonase
MPIISVDGATVDVAEAGSGRDLVVLHSLLAERSAFDRVVPALACNHRLWLVNLPGYGESTAAGSSVEDYADHVARAIRVLGLTAETDVLGNGLGGFVAVALACRHGEMFGRLIVADALATFPPEGKEPLWRMAKRVKDQGMTAVLDAAIQRMFAPAFIAANPAVVAERKEALAKADPQCFEVACAALAQVDLEPLLAGIRNPTLVMAGALDAATPAPLVRRLAAAIPQAKFVEIGECGHCPQLEKPETFVKIVEEFIGV